MRKVWFAAGAIAVGAAFVTPAGAQHHVSRPGTSTTVVGPTTTVTRMGGWNGQVRGGQRQWAGQSRWGGRIDGRWYGGVRAPGGWTAYRRPTRGWVLPGYWFAPSFHISDFAYYGLGSPPAGYRWSRYYDDAVLVDGRGRVFDSVGGVDWSRYDGGYAYDDDYYEGDDRGPRERRDDGVGGAVIGGVIGGIAGNVIAGRGDKLAGTIIGAGAGAIAGAAIDRADGRRGDRRRDRDLRRMPPPPPGAAYPHAGPGYPPPPPQVYRDGRVETRVYHHGGVPHGYYGQGYGYGYGWAGGTTTTVTVMPTTTRTTETITVYESVAMKKKVYRAPARPKTKIIYRAPSKTLKR
ncbi:RcnB family protein [Sphingomonas sp.]|uniref:RcnB family protein n=1 Tax=Sphingomonas sp. TaxID=28214 RepID=UPI002DD62E08|nr:RcnB family protein [Sphingomonas sp.]